MTYVIAEPCIGTEGQLVCRGLSGRLHPPDPGRARLRLGRDALHRPRRVHRLRRLRRGLPGRRLLRRGPAPGRVGQIRRDQRRLLQEERGVAAPGAERRQLLDDRQRGAADRRRLGGSRGPPAGPAAPAASRRRCRGRPGGSPGRRARRARR